MKKWIGLGTFLVVCALAFAQGHNNVTNNTTYASGTTTTFASGSTADIAGTFKIGGTAVTATAAQLNAAGGGALTNLDLGASATAGTLDIFPTTALKGWTRFGTADNAGNTQTLITNASQSGARTYTIPDAGASASFVMTLGTQSITGTKLFGAITATDANVVNLRAGADATAGTLSIFPTTTASGKIILQAADSAGAFDTTITNASQAASRTYTVPDAGGNASFVMTEGTQTINGVKTFGSAPAASGASLTTGTVPRAALAEDALARSIGITPLMWQHATTGAPLLVAETAGTHDLAQYYITGEVTDNETEVSVSQAYFYLPDNYVTGADVSVSITGNWTGGEDVGVASTIVCTLSEMTAGAEDGDQIAGGTQVFTATPTTFTFACTSEAAYAAGDLMRLTLTTSVVDDAAGATSTAVITDVKILCDIKG